jgi:hypothetical protein
VMPGPVRDVGCVWVTPTATLPGGGGGCQTVTITSQQAIRWRVQGSPSRCKFDGRPLSPGARQRALDFLRFLVFRAFKLACGGTRHDFCHCAYDFI